MFTTATPAEQALKDLQDQANVENLQRNKMEAEQALADAQKIRNVRKRNEAVQAAQAMLDEALRAIQIDQLQKQAEEERKAREKEYADQVSAADKQYEAAVAEADRLYQLAVDSAQAEYDREVAANQKLMDEDIRNYEFRRETERGFYEDSLNDLQKMLDDKYTKWSDFQKKWNKLTNDPLFKQAMEDSGNNLGTAFFKGLMGSKTKIKTALVEIATLVKDILKLGSPAKIGPMSTLDTYWKPFAKTLVSGIGEKELSQSLGKRINRIPPVQIGGKKPPLPPDMHILPVSGKKPGDAPVMITINVSGSVIQERDLAETVREELIKIGRRDGSIFGSIV